jgi:hypothetical protein
VVASGSTPLTSYMYIHTVDYSLFRLFEAIVWKLDSYMYQRRERDDEQRRSNGLARHGKTIDICECFCPGMTGFRHCAQPLPESLSPSVLSAPTHAPCLPYRLVSSVFVVVSRNPQSTSLPLKRLANIVFDVLTTGDLEMAMVGAY